MESILGLKLMARTEIKSPTLNLLNNLGTLNLMWILIENNEEVQMDNIQGMNNYTYILRECLILRAFWNFKNIWL